MLGFAYFLTQMCQNWHIFGQTGQNWSRARCVLTSFRSKLSKLSKTVKKWTGISVFLDISDILAVISPNFGQIKPVLAKFSEFFGCLIPKCRCRVPVCRCPCAGVQVPVCRCAGCPCFGCRVLMIPVWCTMYGTLLGLYLCILVHPWVHHCTAPRTPLAGHTAKRDRTREWPVALNYELRHR